LCLATQISTAADPFVPPGLPGQTPGWPTTDLIVINDNNKAQRNMSVHYGLSGVGSKHYAIVRNGSNKIRDFTLRVQVDDKVLGSLKAARVRAEGTDKPAPLAAQSTLILAAMEPGESRWVEFGMAPVAARLGTGFVLDFQELVDEKVVVNGYRVTMQYAGTLRAIRELALFNKAVFRRLAASKIREASLVVKASRAIAARRKLTLSDYLAFIVSVRDPMATSVKRYLDRSGNDRGLETAAALDALLAALTTRRGKNVFATHATLLNKIDVGLTLFQQRG